MGGGEGWGTIAPQFDMTWKILLYSFCYNGQKNLLGTGGPIIFLGFPWH